MHTILYAHDLDGSPADPLPRLLKSPTISVVAPNGQFRSLGQRIADLRAALDAHPGATLVGMGYGALAAMAVALERPADVNRLVLLGPALTWVEPPLHDPDTLVVPASLPVTVFHGADDDITPVTAAREFAAKWPSVSLAVQGDVHDLRNTLPEVAKEVRRLLRAKPKPRTAPKPKPKPRPSAKAKAKVERVRPAKAAPAPPKPKPRKARRNTRPREAERAPLVFAHDIDGRPGDVPATLLYRWKPVLPNGLGFALARRVKDLGDAVAANPGCILGGIGYGAVAAMAVAAAAPKKVRGLLLVAPMLDWKEGDLDAAALKLPANLPTVVLHGSRDLVASLDDSKALVARFPHVQLVIADDVHDLRSSGPTVVGALQDLQAATRRK